jgi:hypothetical protein
MDEASAAMKASACWRGYGVGLCNKIRQQRLQAFAFDKRQTLSLVSDLKVAQ